MLLDGSEAKAAAGCGNHQLSSNRYEVKRFLKALEITSSVLDVAAGEKQKVLINKYFCLFMVLIPGLSTLRKNPRKTLDV